MVKVNNKNIKKNEKKPIIFELPNENTLAYYGLKKEEQKKEFTSSVLFLLYFSCFTFSHAW